MSMMIFPKTEISTIVHLTETQEDNFRRDKMLDGMEYDSNGPFLRMESCFWRSFRQPFETYFQCSLEDEDGGGYYYEVKLDDFVDFLDSNTLSQGVSSFVRMCVWCAKNQIDTLVISG